MYKTSLHEILNTNGSVQFCASYKAYKDMEGDNNFQFLKIKQKLRTNSILLLLLLQTYKYDLVDNHTIHNG